MLTFCLFIACPHSLLSLWYFNGYDVHELLLLRQQSSPFLSHFHVKFSFLSEFATRATIHIVFIYINLRSFPQKLCVSMSIMAFLDLIKSMIGFDWFIFTSDVTFELGPTSYINGEMKGNLRKISRKKGMGLYPY